MRLRRWTPELAGPLHDALVDSFDELHRWMWWAGRDPTESATRDSVAAGAAAFDQDLEWAYVVVGPHGHRVLGSVGVHPRGAAGTVELGYWIRTGSTGRGYATEAARALTGATFAHLADVDRIELRVDGANVRSAAVPPRLGYRVDRVETGPPRAPAQSGRSVVHVLDRVDWAQGTSGGTTARHGPGGAGGARQVDPGDRRRAGG